VTSGTHDTETLRQWWESAPPDERRRVAELPTTKRIVDALRIDLVTAPFETVRDVLLEALFAANSDLLLLPIQDVFGWKDRINEPATIDNRNWSFRLPWPVDRMDEIPEARERQRALWHWAQQYQRNG